MATIPFNPSDLSHLSLPSLPPMKDLSLLLLLKNSFASRMKRSIRSFCHGVASTSTLDQHNSTTADASLSLSEDKNTGETKSGSTPKTLEEMLLQLELEEAAARRAKLEEYGELNRRMSCVNNSDILRSARNALNQYPRFSLDGRDAMYRSSFRRNMEYELDVERSLRMPPTVAGECVVWCKPSVVAKLMGLDAVPVPVPVPVPVQAKGRGRQQHGRRRSSASNRNLVRMGRCELERPEKIGVMSMGRRSSVGSSSAAPAAENGYCVVKPVKGCGEHGEFRRAR